MQDSEQLSLEQIRAFLEGSGQMEFHAADRDEWYGWVNQTLQSPGARGQGTGAALRGQDDREEPGAYRRHRFARRYTPADIELLAEVDTAHETLSGPATQKILHRACHDFGDSRFKRLAELSVAQLYRLRKSRAYRAQRVVYQHTRPTPIAIGERRKPAPDHRPGYVCVDTVQQGDRDGVKGLYQINAVEEVTQWEVVGATAQEAMLTQFPFRMRGFHSDNGSEYIHHRVAALLNKFLVEQTKSRPRHSNDNGLAETKNGGVIRKHIGYGHIASAHAEAFDRFYREHFNPYLNFHRPCGVPEVVSSAKGKHKRVDRWYATPWKILRQFPDLARHLRPKFPRERSDTQAAQQMQEAKRKLFASLTQKRSA